MKENHLRPSRVRYEKEHPAITVHVNKALKQEIDAVRGTKSYASFISELLRKDYPAIMGNMKETVMKDGYQIGYQKGREDFGIKFYCGICSQHRMANPHSNEIEGIKSLLEKKSNIGHRTHF